MEEIIELSFPRRGRHAGRAFSLTTRFPFGFAERREVVTMHHEIVVYPCLDSQPVFEALLNNVTGDLEAWRRGPGHDFYRIRPYEAMESARHVDWKATAHTNSLQVREFARSDDPLVVLYLDIDVPRGDETWFETAVECAAFLAYRLTELGHRVRLRTQEMDVTTPSQGDVHTILRYLALVVPRRGAQPEGPDATGQLQIVFTSDPDRMVSLGWGGPSRNNSHIWLRVVGSDAFIPSALSEQVN
jgi:uncharacterized protein (DUF58 family)